MPQEQEAPYALSDKRHPDNYSDEEYAATYAEGDWCGPPADVIAAAVREAEATAKDV